MGLFAGVKDASLALVEIATMLYPPLHKILAEAMTSHDNARASTGERALADQIRARLGVKSASQTVVEALEREELDELDNPNPEFPPR